MKVISRENNFYLKIGRIDEYSYLGTPFIFYQIKITYSISATCILYQSENKP